MALLIASFAAGLVFGLGLIVSGMSDPAKVLAFLDLAGRWDPSLAFVMLGAVAVAALGFALARRRTVSLLGAGMAWPGARGIDRRLVGGSLLFGIGWGLAGICPGPALVLVGLAGWGQTKGLVFAVAMLAGMALFELAEHAGRRRRGGSLSGSSPRSSP